jgi:hypothetical protein
MLRRMVRFLFALSIASSFSAGCGDDDRRSSPDGSPRRDAGVRTDGNTDPDPDAGPDRRTEVCTRWNADTEDLSEGTWTGDIGSCNAGGMDDAWRARTLAQVNVFRFLAELPPITTDPTRNELAQACSLMMDANGALSHNPPADWDCYTENGAMGAGSSNIASTPAVAAISLYMVDPGNATTLGHRRWILSNSIGPTGIGSTDGASCLWTIGGEGDAGREWLAWPPPGPFPIEAGQTFFTTIDETGWSIQSDEIDLSSASVVIRDEGTVMPVSVTALLPGYGSAQALSIIPMGWTMEVGHTYQVVTTGTSEPISYSVEVVSCE